MKNIKNVLLPQITCFHKKRLLKNGNGNFMFVRL